MNATTAVMQNMQEMGLITMDDEDSIYASIISNDGSTYIEVEKKKSDMHSIWAPDETDNYYTSRITIRFKDTLTGTTRLEVTTNVNAVSSMLDCIESWISFNNSYDCICPLGCTDVMGITYEFSFVAETPMGKYVIPKNPESYYPFTYNLIVLQYNPAYETVLPRLKVELEKVTEDNNLEEKRCTLYDFCDMLFYVAFCDSEGLYHNDWML